MYNKINCMEHGAWSMEHGVWSMEYGVWRHLTHRF